VPEFTLRCLISDVNNYLIPVKYLVEASWEAKLPLLLTASFATQYFVRTGEKD